MPENTLHQVKETLEELLGLPFVARACGYGAQEREMAEQRIWSTLIVLLDLRLTCPGCGTLYYPYNDPSCLCYLAFEDEKEREREQGV